MLQYMSIILYALNRFIKLYYYVQRIAQSIKVEFKAYMFFKWEKMKTVWIHLKDTLVNFDECASKSREKYKIYPSKIKDLLCCEVSEDIGRISTTNYRRKSDSHVVYFDCPRKNCPIRWRATIGSR